MNHLPVQYLIGGTEKLSDAAWALNAKTDAEDETLWLPLVVHLQDTAAVMEYLLWHWLPDDYDDELELTQEKLCKIAIAAALLHDIGKVLYRSDDGRNHSQSGYDFLKNERRCGIGWGKMD